MLHYIIQTIAFQVFFLLVYDMFLKKETLFNCNRFYLLFSVVISLVLPFVKINRLKEVIPKEYIVNLPTIFIGKAEKSPHLVEALDNVNISSGSVWSYEYFIYLGSFIALFVFLFKLKNILLLTYKKPNVKYLKASIFNHLEGKNAFSFFNYIFLGKQLNTEEQQSIIAHEYVHVTQKHTLDLLFFEALRILFWFNPLIYMYQNRVANLHEFIADAKAIKNDNKKHYYESLLSQVFDTKKVSFINPFFKQSLIKKRIIMLSKSKSKQINVLKYTLIIPMVFGMLLYTSCSAQDNTFEEKEMTIMEQIDALKASIKNNELTKEERSEILKLLYVADFKDAYENTKEYDIEVVNNSDEVSFASVDEAPTFPGCETLSTNEEKKKCFSQNVNKLVAQNFNTKLGEELNLKGLQRISVFFKISETGSIEDIKTRAKHPELENEARRVVNLLPQFIPGKQDGKNVNVTFFLPIQFNIK